MKSGFKSTVILIIIRPSPRVPNSRFYHETATPFQRDIGPSQHPHKVGEASYLRPGPNDSPLRHNHDPIPDVIAFAVMFLKPGGVGDSGPISDPGIFVNDGVMDSDILADSNIRNSATEVMCFLINVLIIVGAHQHAITDMAPRPNRRSDADDGSFQAGAGQNTAFRNQALLHSTVPEVCRWQVAMTGEDGPVRAGEVKMRALGCAVHAGPVVGADGSHVLPVPVKDIGAHAPVLDGRRDDFFAKVRVTRIR